MANDIAQLEMQIYELSGKLAKLRAEQPGAKVKNYLFRDLNGEVSLASLFGDKETLFMIHNMGQGCRYCTLWADGLNAFLPHLEDRFAVVLASKDSPDVQRRFANSRQWRFRMVSHGGGEYIREQSVSPGNDNMPGLVCYQRKGSDIIRKNASIFGPGDQFCALWHVISLGGFSEENWTPQYNYWKRPEQLDDGGKGVV